MVGETKSHPVLKLINFMCVVSMNAFTKIEPVLIAADLVPEVVLSRHQIIDAVLVKLTRDLLALAGDAVEEIRVEPDEHGVGTRIIEAEASVGWNIGIPVFR